MGNNRGCQYSVKHTTLDPVKDAKVFWNFDFEEMGLKDLPAEIDFILSKTGQATLGYVGHSEGTTQMFIGSSMKPDYFKSKVNVFVALAPVGRLTNTMSTLLHLMAYERDLIEHVLVDELGLYNMFTLTWVEEYATAKFCSIEPAICAAFLEMFADLDASVDNLSRIYSILTHMPSGAGYRNVLHYAQLIEGDNFFRYDWGQE